MATPAAVLSVMVEANTTKASMALRKFNASLDKTDNSAATATVRTSTLGKASKTASSHLANAAKAAGAAALAYVSISQAKEAVTTTQDLAKATLGLKKNLGLSGRAAGEWAAAAHSRGVATTQLGMGFKTLATQVEAARTGSASALAMFKQLGIGMGDLNKGAKDVQGLMFQISDGMDKAGAGTQRMATVSKLFGRSYAGIAPMIRDGSAALKDNLAATEKYGSALHGQTLKDQEKLRGLLIESKDAWLGIQVSLTKFLTPALDVANGQFQKIAEILADKRLTAGDKFKKVGQIIAGWAQKAFDAFVKILPQMVTAAAQKGPAIAAALIKGFLSSDIWGKLAIGAFLISKFAGFAAISKAGEKTGSIFGKRMGIGLAIGLALALPDLLKQAEALGEKIGAAIKKPVLNFINGGSTTDLVITPKIAFKQGGIPGLTKWLEDQRGITKNAAAEIVDEWMHRMGKGLASPISTKTVTDNRQHADQLTSSLSSAQSKGTASFDHLTMSAKQMQTGISRNINQLSATIGSGFANIGAMTNKALAAFGVKQLTFDLGSQIGAGARSQNNQRGGIIHAQSGVLVPGSGSGDKVPAMLEPGEVVINRKAVAAMGGANKANAINSMIPRFATGGVVLGSGVNMTVGSEPTILKDLHGLATQLRKTVYVISGYRSPAHSVAVGGFPNDPHTRGEAADIGVGSFMRDTMLGVAESTLRKVGLYRPFYPADPNEVNHVQLAGGSSAAAVKAVAETVKRVVLNGPDGPLKSMGQAALDKVRKAANTYIGKQSPKTSSGGGPLMSADGDVQKTFADVARRVSTSKVATLALGEAGFAESGMRDLSYGDSTSQGALQLLASTAAGMGIDPHDEGAIASAFLLKGFYGKGGANALAAQGLPAQLVAQGVQGSATSDGSNYAAQLGPAQAWMKRYGLRRGGIAKFAKGGSVGPTGGSTGSGISNSLQAFLATLSNMRGKTTEIQNRIANAQILDSMNSSPMGSDLSDSERAGEVSLWTKLIANLTGRQSSLGKAIPRTLKGSSLRGRLMKELAGINDITGTEGSLLAARVGLDALSTSTVGDNTALSEADTLRLADAMDWAKRYNVSQAQYGVFGAQTGAVVPSISAPAPVVGNADVRVYAYANGGIADVQVNGQSFKSRVEDATRQRRRPLPSSRGI